MSHRCLDVQRAATPRCVFGRLFGFDPLHPDAVAWYRGALAERRVGRILADLGREWRILHAVPHDDEADIDHLVIGPPGVFAVTASGTVADAPGAGAASRALSRATGMPIVAVPVLVERPRRLVRDLRARPTVYGPDQIATIGRAAEEWTTWRPFAVDAGHTDPDDAFERLHAEVVRARTRRTVWELVGVVVLLGTIGTIATSIFF